MPIDDTRAREGMTHLQAAALEMIEAARAFLDVAEQVIQDPEIVAEVVEVVAGLASEATGRAFRPKRWTGPIAPSEARLGDDDGSEGRHDAWPDERPTRLQRIRVS